MPLEATLTDTTTKLRQDKFLAGCHPEPVEGSLSFPVCVRLHPSAFIPHPFTGISRTAEELYPDREAESDETPLSSAANLREMRETLPGGWLVATNLNNILKKPIPTGRDCIGSGANVIKLTTEVAGLSFGKDVIVEF